MTSIFHLYGLILGVGIVTAIFACEFAFRKWQENGSGDDYIFDSDSISISDYAAQSVQSVDDFWRVIIFACISGIFGARLWHVMTDWHLYTDSPLQILAISQGGLSILGALVGGGIGIFGYLWWKSRFDFIFAVKKVPFWLDLAILGLPLGQIIGRIGNFVNQELYGLPSQLPWAIFIDPINRIAGFEQFATFHPLFLYEIILLTPFVMLVWWWFHKDPKVLGRGNFFALYLTWYGCGRCLFEFLRIDKSVINLSNILGFSLTVGVNQIVLFCMGCVGVIWILKNMQTKSMQKNSLHRNILLSTIALVAVAVAVVGFGAGSDSINQQKKTMHTQQMNQSTQAENEATLLSDLSSIKDRSNVTLVVTSSENESNQQELVVEVVNTQDSLSLGLGMREEIGSDGMLFAFDRPDQRYFWMKGMLIDLDMIWISKGVVVGITENVPAPTAKQQTNMLDLPRYYSPGPVDMVLEVPAGFSRQKGIFTGDTLRVK